jgi:antitoxin component HigA of HigAB toxin-antitoxin module
MRHSRGGTGRSGRRRRASCQSATMILSGKRAISKDNAKKLAERFKVDAGLFI